MNLTGRQIMPQQSTSEEGVLEREDSFDRSLAKLMQRLTRIKRQGVLWKKDLTATMDKLVKLNETKLLHRAKEREAQNREEEKMREQEEDVRRLMASNKRVKKARFEAKVEVVKRERDLGPAAAEQFTMGAWDRAIESDNSPLKGLPAPGNASPLMLLLRSPAPSSVSGSVPFASSSSRQTEPAAAGLVTPPTNKKRTRAQEDNDSVIPISPVQYVASPVAAAAAPAPSSSFTPVAVSAPAAATSEEADDVPSSSM